VEKAVESLDDGMFPVCVSQCYAVPPLERRERPVWQAGLALSASRRRPAARGRVLRRDGDNLSLAGGATFIHHCTTLARAAVFAIFSYL